MNAFETTKEVDYPAHELVMLVPPATHPQKLQGRGAQRDSIYRKALGASDVFATLVVALIAKLLFLPSAAYGWVLLTALCVIPLAKVGGLYERDASLLHKTTIDELPRLAGLAMALSLIAFLVRDLTGDAQSNLGVELLVLMAGLLTGSLAICRRGARQLAQKFTAAERVLVIGSEKDTDSLSVRMDQSHSIDAYVVGRVPIAFGELPYGPSRVLGEPNDLRNIIALHSIERIVIMPGIRHSEDVADVIRNVRSLDVKINIMQNSIDAIGSATYNDDVAGLQMVAIRDARMTHSTRMLKRSMDIVGAAVALLLASPIMLVAAIAIKIDSRGPVFYRQQRIGREGDAFGILKFRTMRNGADAEKHKVSHLSSTDGLFKIVNDPRITRVGRFLRKSSLDELPQLINVLRGDMSLVGPRPLIPEEDSAITGHFRRRSSITPGITGVWQLLGEVRVSLDEMAKLDYLYAANWSLWSDCKILIRTLPHVLGRHGL